MAYAVPSEVVLGLPRSLSRTPISEILGALGGTSSRGLRFSLYSRHSILLSAKLPRQKIKLVLGQPWSRAVIATGKVERW